MNGFHRGARTGDANPCNRSLYIILGHAEIFQRAPEQRLLGHTGCWPNTRETELTAAERHCNSGLFALLRHASTKQSEQMGTSDQRDRHFPVAEKTRCGQVWTHWAYYLPICSKGMPGAYFLYKAPVKHPIGSQALLPSSF